MLALFFKRTSLENKREDDDREGGRGEGKKGGGRRAGKGRQLGPRGFRELLLG